MYLFSDPLDPQQRYIDSWNPTTGVTSYGGLVNESFQDEQINCTIKWSPGRPTAGIYAKRDILLNEELLTGYGKPQWIYAIHFFPHILSQHTIQEAKARYHITNQDTLAPQFAQHITQPSSTAQDPQPHPAPDEPTKEPISTLAQQLPTTANNTPTPPTSLDAITPSAAHTNQHRQQQPINKPPIIPNHPPTTTPSMAINRQPTTAHATPPLSTAQDATTPTASNQQLPNTTPNTPTPPATPDATSPTAHTNQHRQQPTNKPYISSSHQPAATTSMTINQQHTTAHGTSPISKDSDATSSPAQSISNHTSPTLAPPTQVEYPYGTDEGVGVSTSQLPQAGRGLYGLRPHPEAPHLFAKQGQLICVYATQRNQISATTATLSSSRYLWSTNTGNRRNARALYFDAQDAPHYGKFINDKWNAHANNCEALLEPS
jgi:hypothetical protein